MSIKESIETLQRRADFLAGKLSQGTTKPANIHRDRSELAALIRAIDSLSREHNPASKGRITGELKRAIVKWPKIS